MTIPEADSKKYLKRIQRVYCVSTAKVLVTGFKTAEKRRQYFGNISAVLDSPGFDGCVGRTSRLWKMRVEN